MAKQLRKPKIGTEAIDAFAKTRPSKESRSGLVPAGDVRLTANIKEDLHTRLKIYAASKRSTIGGVIEEWIKTLK